MESNFKDRLLLGMKEKGLKAVDLVKLTGLSKSQLSHYMTGRYEAKQIALHKLAVALNVSEAWLMGYDVPMERSEPAPTQSAEREEFAKLFAALSPENRQRILDLMKALLSGHESGGAHPE